MERRVISATPGGDCFCVVFPNYRNTGGIQPVDSKGGRCGTLAGAASAAAAAAYSSAHGVIISTKLVSGPRKDKSVGRGRPIST